MITEEGRLTTVSELIPVEGGAAETERCGGDVEAWSERGELRFPAVGQQRVPTCDPKTVSARVHSHREIAWDDRARRWRQPRRTGPTAAGLSMVMALLAGSPSHSVITGIFDGGGSSSMAKTAKISSRGGGDRRRRGGSMAMREKAPQAFRWRSCPATLSGRS
uniref:Uncharacterized protein n=1 Tax=Oryza barthii TaxID=65489 RepID=A0A0D3EPM7_9ORYZ